MARKISAFALIMLLGIAVAALPVLAGPIVVRHASSVGDTPCINRIAGGYNLGLYNSAQHTITLTGVKVDGEPKGFCIPHTDPAPVQMLSGTKQAINIELGQGDPCQYSGQVISYLATFTYNTPDRKGLTQDEKVSFVCP